jgi:hypothetical protein
LDFGDDINYVIARNPSLMKARKISSKAKKDWPDKEVYITMEKVVIEPSDDADDGIAINASLELCICGGTYGECVGNLSCKCNALAKCKNVTRNPLDALSNFSYPHTPKNTLTPTLIKVVDIRRGVVEVTIPEWNERWGQDESFGIAPSDLPPAISRQLRPGIDLVGEVNLNIQDLGKLVIEDIKIKEDLGEFEDFDYLDDFEEIDEPEGEYDDFENLEDIIEEYETKNPETISKIDDYQTEEDVSNEKIEAPETFEKVKSDSET